MTETPTGKPDPKIPPDSQGPVRTGRAAVAAGWLRRALPNLLFVAALAGLAAWGHRTGWKVPTFSALTGHARTAGADWCPEHGVLASQCVECNPTLLPADRAYGWCQRHGVPECPLDHPDLAQVSGRPQLPRYDVDVALGLWKRPENGRQCQLHQHRIQFASAAAADKAGVDVAVVRELRPEEPPMVESVAASGEISYEPTRVARTSSRVPGTVWRVDVKVGDPVRSGDVLALIDAADVGRAKGEFLQALAQVRLRARTFESLQRVSAAVPDRTLREAETSLSEARIRLQSARLALANLGLPVGDGWKDLPEDQLATRLQFLGLPPAVARSLDAGRATANLLPVTAALDGVVVARRVVAGEVVNTAKTLFVVADPRQVLLTLNVRQEDAGHLRPGLPVRFRPDGDDREVSGRVAWVSTAVDRKTRTVEVRADLPNPDGQLRDRTFGAGRIILREEKSAVVVPREALQWDGDCNVGFVRDKNYLKPDAAKVFHVRKVRPGAQDERYTEVLAGVLPGEVVASKGSGILLAELLKDSLGES